MKKRLILFTAIFSIAVIFTGCGFQNMEPPQTVSIKTSATYEFPIINLGSEKIQEKLDFSKFLDIESMLNSGEDSESKFNVYKYNDNKSKYQQFLFHMPLSKIEFDFAKSFGNMDFSNILKEGFGVEKEFKVPDVQSLNEEKDLDLSSINEALNTGVTFMGAVSPLPLTVTFADLPGMTFSTVKYSAGKFIVDAEENILNPTGGYVEGSVSLLNSAGEVLATGEFKDSKASLDISGKEITRTGMKLQYEGDYVTYAGITFRAYVEASSKLELVTGLNLTSNYFNIPPINVTFPLDLSEDLGNITIEEGKFRVDVTTGDTWSPNVITNYSIDVSGGIECHVNKANPEQNLEHVTLRNQDIEADASVSVTFSNATVDFKNPPKVSVLTEIKKVSAEVVMPEGFETSISKNLEVPDTLKNYVQQITWNKIGFTINAHTNLPAHNDISINIQSTAFGLTDTASQTIYGGREEGDDDYEQKLSFVEEATESNPLITIFNGTGAISEIDISGTIDLPGSAEGKLAVSNVVPGETYKVGIEIVPVFEWATAKVKLPDDATANFDGKFNTGINKTKMFESMGSEVADKLENIQLSSMPLYFFANIPDILGEDAEGLGFGGTIKAYYGKNDGNTVVKDAEGNPLEEYIIGSAEGAEVLTFEPMPELTKSAEDENEVITDLSKYKNYDKFSKVFNLSTSDEDATLYVSYDVGLVGADDGIIDIDSSMLENLQSQEATSISIDVVLVLTLDFSLKAPIEIDLMDFMSMNQEDEEEGEGNSSESSETAEKTEQERDLLNRSPEDYEQFMANYEEYIKAIKSVNLVIEDTKLPLDGTINFLYNFDENDKNANGELHYKSNPFGNGVTATIGIDDVAGFFGTYPLEPKLKLKIGEERNSSFGLLRETSIGGKVKAKIAANKNHAIKVYPFNNQNEGGEE